MGVAEWHSYANATHIHVGDWGSWTCTPCLDSDDETHSGHIEDPADSHPDFCTPCVSRKDSDDHRGAYSLTYWDHKRADWEPVWHYTAWCGAPECLDQIMGIMEYLGYELCSCDECAVKLQELLV